MKVACYRGVPTPSCGGLAASLPPGAAMAAGEPAMAGISAAARDLALEPAQRETATGERYLTVGEIAEVTAMSERQVWRWIESGELQAHNFGRSVRIKESDFAAFTERCRRGPRVNSSHSESVKHKSS